MSYNPYLGEEPPADAYASMSVDDEYEGGQWIDGEFYYDKKRDRPSRQQTKAQAIYGVWADDDDDEENERQAARRSKRRDEEIISDDDVEEEPQVEDEAAGRRGLGLGASALQRQGAKYGRRQAAAEGSSLLTRTMKFVASSSSTTLQPPADNKPSNSTEPPAESATSSSASATPAPASAVHESAPTTTLSFKRRRLAQQAEINRQKQPDPPPTTASASSTATIPVRPFRPPTVDADYAAFTQHSSPAVLQMMERMGFRGRLGKHETGVALPILPQVRPKGVGLGGVKEKVQRVGRNAEEEEKIEQEKQREKEDKRKGKEERRGGSAAAAVGGGGGRDKAWKRGERKGKTVYKTAHQVIQEHSQHPTTTSTSTTTPSVIIDMTSGVPVQKHLSTLSSSTSSTSAATSTASQPSACPELVHNVQLLCDLCENEILDVEKQIERLNLDIDAMQRDETRMKVRAHKDQQAEQRLEAVIAAVAEVDGRMRASEGESVAVRAGIVEQFYRRLRREWMREWRMYGLVRVVVVLLLPLLKELATKWEVLPTKAEGADTGSELFVQLKRWRELLDESTSAVYYDELVNTLLLPPLRLALSSTSLSLQQPAPIVALFQQLRAVLPVRLYSSVVSSLLLQRLQRLLGAYNPRSMAAPYWLLSYASVLSNEELQSLAGVVRQRLMLTIGGWKVEDEVERKEAGRQQEMDEVEEELRGGQGRMVDRVAGWKGVWKEDEMDAFLSRYIQPRLLAAISGLRSSTASTALSSLPFVSAVLGWASLFSSLAFTPILIAILSHFLFVLYSVLSQREPDFEQASDVYEQWKDVLAASVMAQRALVDETSRRALSMMNAAMEDSDVSSLYRDAIHWLKQSKPPTTVAASERPIAGDRPRAAVMEDREGRPMRDVLYAFGAQHGFDVYPHGRRSVSSHDVYWFGGVQVYWSGEDVYAMDERTKEWEMVSLSQLLQFAKQAQAGGRT